MTQKEHNHLTCKDDKCKWHSEAEWEARKRLKAPPFEEAHLTEEGFCCACEYDQAVFQEKLERAYGQGKEDALMVAKDSKSIDGNIMRVRFSPWAQSK